ncbi:MAG: hypothetical protein ACMUJM_26120 [bacterium]
MKAIREISKNSKAFKKAFFISLCVETLIAGFISILVISWGAHSALMTFGVMLQLPCSIIGIIIGQALNAMIGSGALAVFGAITATLLLQTVLLSWILFLIIKRISKSTITRHDLDPL